MSATESNDLDALLPPAIAVRAEDVGVAKAHLQTLPLFSLAVLAGAFIGLGGLFSTTVSAGAAGAVPFGIARLLAGLAFSLGLVLVVVGGAELFTGNTLVVMACASRKITLARMLRCWAIAWAGNFAGAAGTAALVVLSGQYRFGGGSVGHAALSAADAKAALDVVPAFTLGVLCNTLVCLAVWMCLGARTSGAKVALIVGPVAAFVAAGLEHSVANMYFLPLALWIKAYAPAEFWSAIARTPEAFPHLTWGNFLIGNLVPVTLGNVVGGALLVGGVYWSIYLRRRPPG